MVREETFLINHSRARLSMIPFQSLCLAQYHRGRTQRGGFTATKLTLDGPSRLLEQWDTYFYLKQLELPGYG